MFKVFKMMERGTFRTKGTEKIPFMTALLSPHNITLVSCIVNVQWRQRGKMMSEDDIEECEIPVCKSNRKNFAAIVNLPSVNNRKMLLNNEALSGNIVTFCTLMFVSRSQNWFGKMTYNFAYETGTEPLWDNCWPRYSVTSGQIAVWGWHSQLVEANTEVQRFSWAQCSSEPGFASASPTSKQKWNRAASACHLLGKILPVLAFGPGTGISLLRGEYCMQYRITF